MKNLTLTRDLTRSGVERRSDRRWRDVHPDEWMGGGEALSVTPYTPLFASPPSRST